MCSNDHNFEDLKREGQNLNLIFFFFFFGFFDN